MSQAGNQDGGDMKRSLAVRLVVPALLAAAAPLLATFPAMAQDYPQRPIRLIVPYPPGASTDTLGRTVAHKLGESLKQAVVVENRTGASGNIGSELVAKAPPDGYTIGVGTDATHTTNMHLALSPPYDPVKDFTPLTLAVANPIVLVVNPSLPVKTVKDLIEYGRTNPDKISYGSSGNGSPHHLSGELLKQMTGVPFVHVPYRGGSPAVNDVLGGQIPMVFSSMVTVLQHIKSGALRAVAVTQKDRYPGLPDVPSFHETLPGFEMNSWLGLFAPAGVPATIARRLESEMIKALRAPDVKPTMDAAGMTVVAGPAAEFAEQIRRESEQRGKLLKAAGIQPQ
jgi:tripartite-type tricarboxylate transporter receptor subunit TctC